MSNWTKLPPIKGGYGGCLNCGYVYDVAPEGMLIAVGFGEAVVKKDGAIVYDENCCEDEQDFWTLEDAENAAKEDPDHDWRILLDAPLSMREYQRQGENEWVLVNKGIGFA